MCQQSIGTDAGSSAPISTLLEPVGLNSIRKVLPDQAILDACCQVGYLFRCHVFTPVVTVLHRVLAALWPEDSFAASWQTHWAAVVAHFPQLAGKSPSSGSLSKARARLPLGLWERLFEWISRQAQRLSAPFDSWRGHRIVLVDGTCLSMPNTPKLMEHFGTTTGCHGTGAYPLARMTVLRFSPALACEPAWKLPSIYRAMLLEIATHKVPWRPGRIEPRAVRRERKHYPRLRTTREEWRLAHAA